MSTIEALNNIKELQWGQDNNNTPSAENNSINGAKERIQKDANSKNEPTDKEDDIKLNRRIEYSLLQQLINKEGYEKLPN